MLYGPCVRDGVWTGDNLGPTMPDVERMVDRKVRNAVSDLKEEARINGQFGIRSLEEIWSTDEDWED